MNDDSARPRRLWDIAEWGLRWKVLAILVVPLLAASVLGGLRIWSDVSEVSDLRSSTQYVDLIPRIVETDASLQQAALSQGAGTVTSDDIEALNRATNALTGATAGRNLPEDVGADIGQLNSIANTVVKQGVTSNVDVDSTARAVHESATITYRLIERFTTGIDNPQVLQLEQRLLLWLYAEHAAADYAIGGIKIIRDPRYPEVERREAVGAHKYFLNALRVYYPNREPRIDDLMAQAQYRDDIFAERRRQNLPSPAIEAAASLQESKAIVLKIVREHAEDIISTANRAVDQARTSALRTAAIVAGALILTLLVGVLILRATLRPMRRLEEDAVQVSRVTLPAEVDRLNAGEKPEDVVAEPIGVRTREEVGQLSRAFDDLHGQALKLAGEQAGLRRQMVDMFETMARRNRTLVDRQLGLIENLEFQEKDAARLEQLFALDHLAARMRRNSDNLLVLAGSDSRRRSDTGPVDMRDILRAAVSEVEDYERIRPGATPEGAVSGAVATDLVHLIAELLENALRASPPESGVSFTYNRTADGGLLVEITDAGIGIPYDQLEAINYRLSTSATVTPDTTRRMGLFVVGRLAERHGLTVQLRRTYDSGRNPGITASVRIPSTLISTPRPTRLANTPARPDEELTPALAAQTRKELQQSDSAPTPQRAPLPKREPAVRTAKNDAPQAQGPQQRPAPRPAPAPAAPPARPIPQPLGPSGTSPVNGPGSDQPGAARRPAADNGAGRSADTPIFAGMMSAWLSDPSTGEWELPKNWNDDADSGWSAARRASESQIGERTGAGLPRRDPGSRLVPGGVDVPTAQPEPGPRRRDPESIRANLSRHQRGVREGRSVKPGELAEANGPAGTATEGER